MLRVVKTGSPGTPVDESDNYLELNLAWVPVRPGGLVYYYARDPRQGYVELKIDEHTGEIVETIMITAPARRITMPPLDLPTTEGSVCVDVSQWAGLELTGPGQPGIDENAHLALAVSGGDTYLSLSDLTPARYVMAGFAGFAVDADDNLVGVLVRQVGRLSTRDSESLGRVTEP